MLAAQAPAAPPANAKPASRPPAPKHAAQPKGTGTHRRRAASSRARPAPVTVAATVPAPPPQPVIPDWPANQQPSPAQVTWDSHGLQVVASNSSLDQILHEVATDVGAKVSGLSHDQRVFGAYGPGAARDVINKLLDGSGYNVLMIGDQGNGAPRQIVLSTRGSAPAGPQPPGARPQNSNPGIDNGDDTSDADEQSQQEDQPQPQQQPVIEPPMHPQPIRNPFGNGVPPRTPQQIQQEMQQNNPQ